jgi:hypothetical protein
MNRATAWALAAATSLGLTGCAANGGMGGDVAAAPPPVPPASAEQDLTAANNQQVAAFVSTDPGWHAWLYAFRVSDQANNAVLDTSTYTTPTIQLIQAVTLAQDAYRSATSFQLPPFAVTSSCQNLPSETNGAVRLLDGLIVRYRYLHSFTKMFDNGASCRQSVGFISEVDSSRGLPIVTADPPADMTWQGDFAPYLVWNTPFSEISRNNLMSLSDLVTLIETGRPPSPVKSPSQCILF